MAEVRVGYWGKGERRNEEAAATWIATRILNGCADYFFEIFLRFLPFYSHRYSDRIRDIEAYDDSVERMGKYMLNKGVDFTGTELVAIRDSFSSTSLSPGRSGCHRGTFEIQHPR